MTNKALYHFKSVQNLLYWAIIQSETSFKTENTLPFNTKTHAVQLDSSQTRKPLFWGFLAEISMFLDISNMPGQENDAQDI